MTVYVTGPRDRKTEKPPATCDVINTTSRGGWSSDLSPFKLGPCPLYRGAGRRESRTMENLWQYAKVYAVHADEHGNPLPSYRAWACAGWDNPQAVRYPMGKGQRPLYSLWGEERLQYIDARKRIYIPQYAAAVVSAPGWPELQKRAEAGDIALWDFDGYNHRAHNRSLIDVVNDPARACGHAFILCALLTGELDPGACLEHLHYGTALYLDGHLIAPLDHDVAQARRR